MARTKYYPHEKTLKVNEIKIIDLPIPLQNQIGTWRKNKELGYHSKYVSESERIAKGIENYIESDIESLYTDIEKQPIPNQSHTIGFISQNEVKSNSEPQNEVKKDIEKQPIPYQSHTIGFTNQKQAKNSSEPQNSIEKDIELQPIPNHSEINTVLLPKEVKNSSEPQNSIEKGKELQTIPNHSEINTVLPQKEVIIGLGFQNDIEKGKELQAIPNHSEINTVLPQKEVIIGLCPKFCEKIGNVPTACYSILKHSEKENIEPIFNLNELEELGIKRGFWSDFSKGFGYTGKYFRIKRVGNMYEVISLLPLPNEAFIEIDTTTLITSGEQPKEVKELDFTDFNKVNDFITCQVSNSIQESKFYDSLSSIEKVCYDLLKNAKKHVIATFDELKNKGIKISNEGFESAYFRIVPLKNNAFRITRKNCNV